MAAAWVLLGVARLVTVLVPFRLVRRLLGEHQGAPSEDRAPGTAPAPVDTRAESRAWRIGRIVRLAARRTPWRSDCYPQALTARLLLRAARVPHDVTFGLRRDDAGALRAHAWVSSGRVPVTGGSRETWVGVGTFAWSPRRP